MKSYDVDRVFPTGGDGKVLPPPSENLCYNALKTTFLAVAVAPAPFLGLTSDSLCTQVKPILILINAQYLQNVVFGLEKGSKGQNHNFAQAKFPIPFIEGDSTRSLFGKPCS